MSSQPLQPDAPSQAVFTVRAAGDTASACTLACTQVSGSFFTGEFQEYITANRRPEFSPAVKDAKSCVALIDCDANPQLALETMERLQQLLAHKVNLIALASHKDDTFLLRAMRAGCNDFLHKPIKNEELTAALLRFQSCQQLTEEESQGRGRILTFYGIKGGVGTTTLAVHLAIHLVQKHKKKVLLIDHKHELGHVSLHLGIKQSTYFFDELIRNVDRLDSALLAGFVVRHPSGMEVIPSPDGTAQEHPAAPEATERVMKYLSGRYDFIVVDSSTQYRSTLAPMVSVSDEIYLVCTPDVAALRDLARHIESLGVTDEFAGKLRVVLNRSTSGDVITTEQIVKAVGHPVKQMIPNCYAEVLSAINSGEPLAPPQRGPFPTAVGKWASRLISEFSPLPVTQPAKKRFSFWK